MESKNCGSETRMIGLPGGLSVGIQGLDETIAEVAALKLEDFEQIGQELVKRVAEDNFVAPGAEKIYATALLKAYKRKTGVGDSPPAAEPKKKHAG